MGPGPSGPGPSGPGPGGPGPRLLVYGRAYCHLCDDMIAALDALSRNLGFAFSVVDVDADPLLEARWNEAVPVLATADGVEICRHVLDRARLDSALAAEGARRIC